MLEVSNLAYRLNVQKLWKLIISGGACMLSHKVMSDLLQPRGLQPTKLLCPWDSLGKNTGVGCHFLLRGIFPTEGLKAHLLHILHWQAYSLPLSHLGNPNRWPSRPKGNIKWIQCWVNFKSCTWLQNIVRLDEKQKEDHTTRVYLKPQSSAR